MEKAQKMRFVHLKGYKPMGYRMAYNPKAGAANVSEEDYFFLQNIERERRTWEKVGLENGWSEKETFVQVWINPDGSIVDSVSFKGMTQDIFFEYAKPICPDCGLRKAMRKIDDISSKLVCGNRRCESFKK